MSENPSSRDEFLTTVRRALGKTISERSYADPQIKSLSSVHSDEIPIKANAPKLDNRLVLEAEHSAHNAGWAVYRAVSNFAALEYIAGIINNLNARYAIRSDHRILDDLGIEEGLESLDVELTTMLNSDSSSQGTTRNQIEMRRLAIAADIGITGADYVIAETGSCVLLPRAGLSRLVSLLPPVHVAVVRKDQILPSLDELFRIIHVQKTSPAGRDNPQFMRYGTLISGPSRSGDIEQTLTIGVHGPGEVHLVMLD